MSERSNVHTAVWGRHTWVFLHAVAASYPERPSEEDRRRARVFFGSLRWALPCGHCREEYAETLRKHPVDTRSREALERWVWECHSGVNRRLGKPGPDPDLATVQGAMRGGGRGYGHLWLVSAVALVLVAGVLGRRAVGRSRTGGAANFF